MSHSPADPPASVSRPTASAPPANPLADVKQLGMWAAIASLGYVFWVVGAMEMIERLAYYGVRAVATLYATRPASEHGLGVTMAQFGWLLLCWNLAQSLVPIFTGGLSDRYGYKQTIFVSTLLKCLAYLIMAWWQTFTGFFVGAMFLAVGTAVFKPGIQGTLIKATNRLNSSMAWGIFYQTVNIGGWIGPLIALHMRSHMGWQMVFYTNAAFICLNFLLLLTYREPGLEERRARRERIRAGLEQERPLWRESLAELRKPHLTVYLLIFSVWWLMFPMLWDVLPKYVEDWVDTRPMVTFLFGADGAQNALARFLLGMDAAGQHIQPEGIVNINAGMIMLTCFLFAGLSAKMRATDSLLAGTLLIVTALTVFGMTRQVGWAVLAMVIFSAGEMLASPKYSEFLGNVAPPDKKAMWIGFSQAPILIGWTIEGKLGPHLYHVFSDKDQLARRTLVEELGWSWEAVSQQALPVGEAFRKLVEVTGQSPEALTRELYDAYHVGTTWFVFAGIGVLSAGMIYLYGRWIRKLAQRPMEP
jgi:POT family proton-dependent oligopeptide transporter